MRSSTGKNTVVWEWRWGIVGKRDLGRLANKTQVPKLDSVISLTRAARSTVMGGTLRTWNVILFRKLLPWSRTRDW